MPARHFAYYSEWESEILTCPNCGWRGTFIDGDTEHYEQLMDTSCPQCDDAPMLAIVSYPTREETRANLDKLSPEEQQRFMGLSEITADGVEKAIAEFDEIGREVFLEKYGFGKAKSYFLLRENNRYDSKAIVGVAHGYSGEDLEPLTNHDFSGGESTVVPCLKNLGFSVETNDSTGAD